MLYLQYHPSASKQKGKCEDIAMLNKNYYAATSRSCAQDRGPAPVAADLQLQRRLAGGQAEQRVPKLVVAEHAVLVAVRVPFNRE